MMNCFQTLFSTSSCAPTKWYATGTGGTGGGGGGEEVVAVALRSGFEFALPLRGYANGDDRRMEQDAKYRAFGAQFTSMFQVG